MFLAPVSQTAGEVSPIRARVKQKKRVRPDFFLSVSSHRFLSHFQLAEIAADLKKSRN